MIGGTTDGEDKAVRQNERDTGQRFRSEEKAERGKVALLQLDAGTTGFGNEGVGARVVSAGRSGGA